MQTLYDRRPTTGGEIVRAESGSEVVHACSFSLPRRERANSDDEDKTPGRSLRTVQNEDPKFHKESSIGHNYKYGPGDDAFLGKAINNTALSKRLQQLQWKPATFDDAEKFSRIAVLDNEWGAIKFLHETVRHTFHDGDSRHSVTISIAGCEVRMAFSYGAFEVKVATPHPLLNIVVCCDTAVVDGFLDRDELAWTDKLHSTWSALTSRKSKPCQAGESRGWTVELTVGTVKFGPEVAAGPASTTAAVCSTPRGKTRDSPEVTPLKRPAATQAGPPKKKR